MKITEENLKTIEACRYCLMCRHVCSSEFISYRESDTPRGRAILLYNIYKGDADYDDDTIESIYNCFLCGCCWSWCEGRDEGGYNIPELIKFARKDIVSRGKAPLAAEKMRKSLIEKDNPYDIKKSNSFSQSIEEKKADITYYMGPEISFRNHEIAEAAVKIFDKLKVNFTLLKDEPTSGKILDMLGYHDDAIKKAEKLYKRIKDTECSTVIVSDPLAYDAFKNDYHMWGFKFTDIKVLHLSEYLADLIKAGKLKLGKTKEKVSLADSEYLGRFNGIFDQPRVVIEFSAGSNFVEMRWNREKLLATGEVAFVFQNKKFASGRELGDKICIMAKDVGAKKVVTLSATAKNNINKCPEAKTIDIAEFVAELI